jgi:ribosomal 50S subunit-recycling heat shock protein
MVRLDIFLKSTGLVKQRREAKRACDDGRVRVDGQRAKAGRPVKVGEVISIETAERYVEAEVLAIPGPSPARKERGNYCRIRHQEDRDPHADLGF